MYILILLFPLLSFIILSLFGNKLRSQGSAYIALYCLFCALFLSIICFIILVSKHTISIYWLFQWLSVGFLLVNWGFLFDTLTIIMCIVVTVVSFLVHLYSIDYMSMDPTLPKFLSFLSLFTFFMLLLVSSDNFLQLFFGWEGVGLSSYLLINFWYTREQANKAAIKAILVNRIGDFGLLVAILLIFYSFKSFNFAVIFSLADHISYYTIYFFSFKISITTLICFFLFIGVIGKSAQFILHTWLPDAMEGPTPVSALIHAATMVTAGVFLLIRCSPLFESSPVILSLIIFVGAITAFFASLVGWLQNDIKKIIAYSTCSQLGYMVFTCGLSNYMGSMLHLVNHAFFKALLFLSAGSIIHALSGDQDIRKMGGLINLLPYTYIMLFTGSLALMGFPFSTGFFSKDLLLEFSYTFSYNVYISIYIFILAIISAFSTAFYSFRLLYLVFFTKPNFSISYIKNIHDAPIKMAISLFILWIGTVFLGYWTQEWFIGLSNFAFWSNSISPKNWYVLPRVEYEFGFWYVQYLPLFFSIIGVIFGLFFCFIKNKFFFKKFNFNNLFLSFYLIKFISGKWLFDFIYNKYINKLLLIWGYNISFKLVDRGLIELLGPLGLVRLGNILSNFIIKLQTGVIYNYIFLIFIGLFFIIIIINIKTYLIYFGFDLLLLILLIFINLIIWSKNKGM